jgi:exodeoxyribonuclease III
MSGIAKIASWNVNSINIRQQHLYDWIQLNQPDVIAIQETKTTDDNFPAGFVDDLGYHCYFYGQKSYNGVAFLTKDNLASSVKTDILNLDDIQARTISLVYQNTLIVNVYVPNGSSLDSDKYPYKLKFLSALHGYLKAQQQNYSNIIVLGDFNIAPEDIDCHDPEKWQESTIASPEVRESLNNIQALGLTDTFRQLNPESTEYSWWDYRQAAFRRNLGLRIDLILASNNLLNSLVTASIDKTTRKLERPSDHAPVILEFKL